MRLSSAIIGRPRRPELAYTLAEVVVSVFILSIIGTALLSGISFGFSVVGATREDLRATQILMQKAEAVRICNWNTLQANCPISFQEWYDPIGAQSNAGGATYYGTLELQAPTNIPNSASYRSNIVLVNVTVNWTGYNGSKAVPHTRQLQTQVARYGLQNYIWEP